MIPRVTAPHHRVLLGCAFHVAAGQVIEQHVVLGGEQLAVAFHQVPLKAGLVRDQPVQAPIEPRVVDLARLDVQQIIQRSAGVPAFFNGQLTAWRAQAVDRQQRRDPRPRHVGRILQPVQ